MARRVRKFVDRAVAKTVDLELLRRLIEPYADKVGFSWASLPAAEAPRREAVFELFRKADGRFPAELQFTLFNICCVATEAGARFPQLHADAQEVELVPRGWSAP